jgi:methionine sulfoxide reductase catalytic subunit
MLIKCKNSADIPSSEITPKDFYMDRRKFMIGAGALGASFLAGRRLLNWAAPTGEVLAAAKFNNLAKSGFSTSEKQTPFKDVTHYNNFYEFGTAKEDPAEEAKNFKTRPWSVAVEGEAKNKKSYDLDEIAKLAPMEERIYRHRCVEGWSIVVPWIGFPLNALIKKAEPTSKAKYVAFQTLLDPKQMPGQRGFFGGGLDWPYVEGLRMDEAMNPLALLCFGMYGEELPNQDGAPIRLVVPWKYGFKSIKSIVKIQFVEKEPPTTWNRQAPNEYGFYSNVNPNVDHPRWSQATERRLGEFFRRKTLMFNGYGDQVASMYSGMDLRKYY